MSLNFKLAFLLILVLGLYGGSYMDGREIGTSFMKHSTGEIWNPDFAKMAEAMGAGAATVEHPSDLGSAFETALASGRPYLIDVKVNRDTPAPLIGTWQFAPIPQAEPTFGRAHAFGA